MNSQRAPAIWLLLVLLLGVTSACQSEDEPPPMMPLNQIEGGVVRVAVEARTITLDARAAPYTTLQLGEPVEIVGTDRKPLSVLDLKSGDLVRAEGTITGADTFRATRIAVLRAVVRSIPSPTPSIAPPVSPTASRTPLIPGAERTPLPGTLLIADHQNRRVLEIDNDKKIVWAFAATDADANVNLGAPTSVTWTPTGKSALVTASRQNTLAEIDYAARKIVWTFGTANTPGADARHLDVPRDAQRLRDGRTLVADIHNCRLAFIAPAQHIVEQIGKPGECRTERGAVFRPNSVAFVGNGRVLITELGSRRITEYNLQGKSVRGVNVPNGQYLASARLTASGNVLVAVYDKPGRVLEVDWNGQIVWDYFPLTDGERLDRPSLALELPNGNLAINDDYNHRIVIVNRVGKTVWQYGVTGVAGNAPGYLNTPMGFDFRTPLAAPPTGVTPTLARPRTPAP